MVMTEHTPISLPDMNSFQHPIANTQFPTGEGLEQPLTLDISRLAGLIIKYLVQNSLT
jgi:hypothetical protein